MPTKSPKKPKTDLTLLNWSEIKKQLENFSSPGYIGLIKDLYDASSANKAFLSARFALDPARSEEVLKGYRQKIRKFVFPDITSQKYDRPAMGEGRKIISAYKKATDDTVGLLDLMLYYVETGTAFTNAYGDIDEAFYISLETILEEFQKLFEDNPQLYMPHFQERLKKLYKSVKDIGWGYGDTVRGIVYELFDGEPDQGKGTL